jgi:hypothetical protein
MAIGEAELNELLVGAIEMGGVMGVETMSGSVSLDEHILQPLRAGLRGDVIHPGDEGYDDAPGQLGGRVRAGPAARDANVPLCGADALPDAAERLAPAGPAGVAVLDRGRPTDHPKQCCIAG